MGLHTTANPLPFGNEPLSWEIASSRGKGGEKLPEVNFIQRLCLCLALEIQDHGDSHPKPPEESFHLPQT